MIQKNEIRGERFIVKPIEHNMIIYWIVRYYSEAEKRVKQRIRFLNTASMPMDVRFPFMFRVEAENLLKSLDLRNYKNFFIEVDDRNHHTKEKIDNETSLSYTDGGTYYFETESEEYLPEWELRRIMGKECSSSDFPRYTDRYLEHNKNTEINFSSDEIRQLQIFTDNYNELKVNRLKAPTLSSPTPLYRVWFDNTETELQAYALNFRKIYSRDGQAGGSFPDLCEAIKTHEDTALALLAEDSLAYFDELRSVDVRSIPREFMRSLGAPSIYQLFENYSSKVTIHDLIQLFFYTQYHHNPHSGRVEELNNLKSFLKRCDADDILKYMFFMALWTFQMLFLNAGQSFVGMFQVQISHPPDSTKIKNLGERSATTEDLRRRNKFEALKRSFAQSLWIEAGRPECGAYYFEDEAERRMLLGLGRIYI